MVKTRGQRSNQPEEEEEVEPPQTEDERSRDRQVAANNKKMQALGLKVLASAFNKSVPPSESRHNKGNKKTNSNDSESSDYHLDDDDQGCTSDDDTELSDEGPMSLEIKYPAAARKAKTKRNTKMPPGSRNSKRVRAGEQPVAQTQRRTSKRLNSSETDVHNEEQHEDGHGDTAPNLSTPGLADHDSIAAEEDMASNAQELGPGSNEHPIQQTEGAADANLHTDELTERTEGPPQRAPRRPRPPTKGKKLEKFTKAMGRRLPISVNEGKKRPHEPVQAAKFASEAGVIMRESFPLLPHWKDYKKDEQYYKTFVSQLSMRLAVDDEQPQVKEAITDMLRSMKRQERYRLKARYFNGVPANQIRTTSPVARLTDEQWRALVVHWSDPKNMETCDQNKRNRSKVQFYQATGSRSYEAHLHEYKKKRIREEPSLQDNEELDVVEAFKSCHTSSKRGLTEPAREALIFQADMEALRAQVPEGEAPVSSVEVISKVLSQNSSNQFLKSVGIKTPGSNKSSSTNESELRERLAAEARAAVQDELDNLRRRSEEAEAKMVKQQQDLDLIKQMLANNANNN